MKVALTLLVLLGIVSEAMVRSLQQWALGDLNPLLYLTWVRTQQPCHMETPPVMYCVRKLK